MQKLYSKGLCNVIVEQYQTHAATLFNLPPASRGSWHQWGVYAKWLNKLSDIRPPPLEWHGKPGGRIGKLLKFPYGVTEASQHWATVVEAFLTSTLGMLTVTGVPQLL